MNVWRNYLAGMGFGAAGLISLIGAANWIVDPFWFYGAVSMEGFNAIKPEFSYRERESKPFMVERRQPSAVILGSSYAEIGLDPAHPALAQGGYDSFNFGLIGGSWERIYCNFDFALGAVPLKRVILAIDVYAMPAVRCDGALGRFSLAGHLGNLLSIDTLKSSLLTLLQQTPGARTHDENGLFFYTKRSAGVFERFADKLAKQSDQGGGGATPVRDDFTGLERLIERAAAKNVEIVILIHPGHAYLNEVIIHNRAMARYWERLRGLVAAVEARAEVSGVEVAVWDFSDYNELTAEPVRPRGVMTYWQDPRHYNTAFGDAMFDRMFGRMFGGGGDPAFGRRLATATFEDHVAAFETGREAYLASHPEFAENLKIVFPGAARWTP